MAITITPELLASGHKYRRELLAMLVVSLEPILAHMTPRYGIQGKESVGALSSKAQLRPYKFTKNATDTTEIAMRTLETFLGDVVEEFDPHALWSTVFGSTIGEDPSQAELARQMSLAMAGMVGENLALNVFKAVRKDSGTTTADLFNGFETIVAAEKTAGKLSVALKNLVDVGAISEANVVDVLMAAYLDGTHEVLRGQNTKMFIPASLYSLYNKGYRNDFGSVPYNKEFKKTFLEGTDQKCELVPMAGMGNTQFIITPKSNMLVGMDQNGNKEKVEVRRPDNPKAVQFFMLAYFGVQFESIDPRTLCVGEYTTA